MTKMEELKANVAMVMILTSMMVGAFVIVETVMKACFWIAGYIVGRMKRSKFMEEKEAKEENHEN